MKFLKHSLSKFFNKLINILTRLCLQNFILRFRLSLAIPREGDGYKNCEMYAVNFTEMIANGVVKADPKWPTKPCENGWEYSFSEIPYSTIATELDWVCDNAYLPTVSQSIFFCGAIIGGLLFGWIADRFGRIPALAGCNLIGFVAG